MMKTYLQAAQERKDAKFMPRQKVFNEYYDCVTFMRELHEARGILKDGEKPFPRYSSFSRGDSMLKEILKWHRECNLFDEVEYVEGHRYPAGSSIVFSHLTRGHHVAIQLEDGGVTHCVRGGNVEFRKIEEVCYVFKPFKVFSLKNELQ